MSTEETSIDSRAAAIEAEVAQLRARLQFASMVEKERAANDRNDRRLGTSLSRSVADVMALSLIALAVGSCAYVGVYFILGRLAQLEAALVELHNVQREMMH